MAKHCPNCLEEYEDWAEDCPDCNVALAEGSPPALEEEDPQTSLEPAILEPTPEELAGYTEVWRGEVEDGLSLATLLQKEGLPAVVTEEERSFEDETAPAFCILLPPDAAIPAMWFLKGFERAVTMLSDQVDGPPSRGSCCG
jgi:hypothetical protein